MLGTAPRVDFWILLEYPQIWNHDPIAKNNLPVELQRWLARTIASRYEDGLFPRVQMIRRNREDRTGYSMYVVQNGELTHYTLQSYEEILDLDICNDFGKTMQSHMYFVCNHGQRDRCCAKFGHPTWKILNNLATDRVWQCSHLGGHRFAPNVLVLPQGRLYGRVHAKDAKRFYQIIERGEIAFDFLRGRSEYKPEDQVHETGIKAVRDGPIQVRERCNEHELKTVYPFIETWCYPV